MSVCGTGVGGTLTAVGGIQLRDLHGPWPGSWLPARPGPTAWPGFGTTDNVRVNMAVVRNIRVTVDNFAEAESVLVDIMILNVSLNNIINNYFTVYNCLSYRVKKS
jgi:hypothetical protein